VRGRHAARARRQHAAAARARDAALLWLTVHCAATVRGSLPRRRASSLFFPWPTHTLPFHDLSA
jgi:hypothetical protein